MPEGNAGSELDLDPVANGQIDESDGWNVFDGGNDGRPDDNVDGLGGSDEEDILDAEAPAKAGKTKLAFSNSLLTR